jgi:hypothetical protein
MGQLIPIANVEVLPGDSFRWQSSALIRVTPQLKPLMHPCQVRIHHFFVPYRLVWSGWEDFITNAEAGTYPTITGGAHTEGSLSDYLGVYNDASNNFGALHVRCYNKIFNEFYRDKDLVSPVSDDTDTIQNIAWEKDFATAARATPQQGTAVSLPLGTSAQVLYGPNIAGTDRSGNSVVQNTSGGGVATWEYDTDNPPDSGTVMENSTTHGLYADLSNATAATVAQVREAFQLQKFAEARQNWGDEYVDYLRYLGIRPSDARLQRPEYLAGGKTTIAFSEVLNTTGANTPGDMVGHGIAAVRSNRFKRFFEEHGCVMTLMSVRPKAIYVNNLPKKFSRDSYDDYYQRELETIGDEPVLNKEIYAGDSGPTDTFGYSPRYYSFRKEDSYCSAEMRNSTNYDFHMGRLFSSDVALNQSFIECSPTKRCFADQTEDSLWVMCNHSIQARRQVRRNPQYGGF